MLHFRWLVVLFVFLEMVQPRSYSTLGNLNWNMYAESRKRGHFVQLWILSLDHLRYLLHCFADGRPYTAISMHGPRKLGIPFKPLVNCTVALHMHFLANTLNEPFPAVETQI